MELKNISGKDKGIKRLVQNYIFELFKILQCKTGNEFRKSHLFKSLDKFLTFPWWMTVLYK